MKLYITGATGFVGSHVVDEAVRQGHEVVAVVRPASAGFTTDSDGGDESDDGTDGTVRPVQVDLRSRDGLAASLAGVDTVIHLAAAKEGDLATQFAGTVVATENLLTAMTEAGVTNLVGVSTFSVYDYRSPKPGTLIDEGSPTDQAPALRDEYARTKLLQEDLYRQFAADESQRCVIVRPGMIYGPHNLWHALLGAEFGPRFLKIGSKATLPLTYVENCAEAIVLAADGLASPESTLDGEVINIVDDHLPSQRDYADLVAERMETPASVSLPWPLVRAAAGLLQRGNEMLVGGRAKFPGIAVPDRLDARFKPLRFTNRKAKDLLGWSPRYNLITAIDRSIAVQEGLTGDRATDDEDSGGR